MINTPTPWNPMLQPSPWESLVPNVFMPGFGTLGTPSDAPAIPPPTVIQQVTDYNVPGGWTTAFQPIEGGLWKDVGSSRALATVYQNTNARKRRVNVTIVGANNSEIADCTITVGPANPPTFVICKQRVRSQSSVNNSHVLMLYGEVPKNWYYQIDAPAGASLNSVFELDE